MRDIKFRAWKKKSKVMVFFDWFAGLFPNLGMEEETYPAVEKEYDIMQYTGLHDKNGREIYEGDVVKIVHEDESHDHDEDCEKPCLYKEASKNVVVEWNKEFAGFTWDETELFDGEYIMGFNAEPYIYEVIGNIRETPDIIKTN